MERREPLPQAPGQSPLQRYAGWSDTLLERDEAGKLYRFNALAAEKCLQGVQIEADMTIDPVELQYAADIVEPYRHIPGFERHASSLHKRILRRLSAIQQGEPL